MAKKVTGYIKLQIPAGKATPAPPVGPALGHSLFVARDEQVERNLRVAASIIEVVDAVAAAIVRFAHVGDGQQHHAPRVSKQFLRSVCPIRRSL